MKTFEFVVPVRPGDVDKYPPPDLGLFSHRKIVCADGNLSAVYQEALRTATADIVVFKHDDVDIRDLPYFCMIVDAVSNAYPIIGVAGTRAYIPRRNVAWWQQGEGTQRGLVHHSQPNLNKGNPYPTFFGAPGAAVVVDGCLFAVRRDIVKPEWFDTRFRQHFYDVAFCVNAFHNMPRNYRSAFVIVADVYHRSVGPMGPEWQKAADLFMKAYGSTQLMVI